MFFILAFTFIIIPALEIYLLFHIGGFIGGFNTFLLVVLTGVLGATMAKAQGLEVYKNLQLNLNQGAIPSKQIMSGLLILAGGLLLLTPGFVTDTLGFLMILPFSRNIFISFLVYLLEQAIKNGHFQVYTNVNGDFSGKKNNARKVGPNTFEAEYRTYD